ncbi:MAG: EipB family protein [Alphaproteobacteria bacterium]
MTRFLTVVSAGALVALVTGFAASDVGASGKAAPAAVASPASSAMTSETFAPHKALYELKLVSVSSGAGVTDIRGNMLYEQDDACDAWTTDHRFTIEYYYPERPASVNTTHYVSWEAKDQSQFQFSSERQENGTPTEQLRGAVTRGADTAAVAEFSRPEDLYYELPKGYVLPSFHTQELIRYAREGRQTYHSVLFDGTDKDGPIEVNAIITRKLTREDVMRRVAAAPKEGEKMDKDLLSADAWLVRMAVFPTTDAENMSPTYEMNLVLHGNGVVSHVLVDYKSFKVEQTLTAIEPLPKKNCR